MDIAQKLLHTVASVLIIAVYLDAATAKPSLCPTNKIAPHRRAATWREGSQQRTLGLIYNLITPGRPSRPFNNINDLQEEPQEDDPNDCGDIEDYDENDLSSITPGVQNVYNKRGHRQRFGDSHTNRPYYLEQDRFRPTNSQRPSQKPQRPTFYPPYRPTPNSAETYGFHSYGLHLPQNPLIRIKPVHENLYDYPTNAYRPDLVGGIFGQVFGVTTVRPTFSSNGVTSHRDTRKPSQYQDSHSNNRRRVKTKQQNVPVNIIGSFVDLLFN